MRKFLAYIILCITMFLLVGFTFNPVTKNVRTDSYYGNMYTYTFQLFDRESGERLSEGDDLEKKAVDKFVELTNKRLNAWGVSDSKIETETGGIINVTFSAKDLYEYEYVVKLLSSSGELSVFTSDVDSNPKYYIDGSEIFDFKEKPATISYSTSSNDIVIPLTEREKLEEIYEHAKELENDANKEDENKDEEEREEGEESEEEPKETLNALIVALNWDTNIDSFDKVQEDIDGAGKKIVFKLNANSLSGFFEADQLRYSIKLDGSNLQYGPGPVTENTEVKGSITESVYSETVFFNELINSTADNEDFNFKVVNIYKTLQPTLGENLIDHGIYSNVAISNNFRATFIAMGIAAIILSFFYGIIALGTCAVGIGSSFLTFLFFVGTGSVFSIGTMVGLIILFLMSVFSWALFYHYFKEEVYKGRNIKKSYQEASKKTTMPIVDTSVFAFILGLFTFYLGGSLLHSLGTILIIGSIVGVVFNLLLSKFLLYLLTNDNFVENNLKLLNIKKDLIPSILEGEKASKYKPLFAEKDFRKHKKPAFISLISLALCAVVGLITFSAIPNMSLFNSNEYKTQEKIHITLNDSSSKINTPELLENEVLKNICVKEGNEYKTFNYSDDIFKFVRPFHDIETSLDVEYTFYVVTLNENYDFDTQMFYLKNPDGTCNPDEVLTLNEALDNILDPYLNEDSGEFKILAKSEIKSTELDIGLVFGITFATIGIMSVYFVLRFKPSRALTYLVSTSISVFPIVGLTALFRIPCGNLVTISLFLVLAVSTLFSLFVMSKSKDMLHIDKVTGFENLYKQYNEATLFSLEDNSIVIYTALLILLVFGAFGSTFANSIFLTSALGSTLFAFVLLILNPFIYKFFVKMLSQITLPKISFRFKKKQKVSAKPKSNEPEEAIFVGIND